MDDDDDDDDDDNDAAATARQLSRAPGAAAVNTRPSALRYRPLIAIAVVGRRVTVYSCRAFVCGKCARTVSVGCSRLTG
jgi:hypothetical protein